MLGQIILGKDSMYEFRFFPKQCLLCGVLTCDLRPVILAEASAPKNREKNDSRLGSAVIGKKKVAVAAMAWSPHHACLCHSHIFFAKLLKLQCRGPSLHARQGFAYKTNRKVINLDENVVVA